MNMSDKWLEQRAVGCTTMQTILVKVKSRLSSWTIVVLLFSSKTLSLFWQNSKMFLCSSAEMSSRVMHNDVSWWSDDWTLLRLQHASNPRCLSITTIYIEIWKLGAKKEIKKQEVYGRCEDKRLEMVMRNNGKLLVGSGPHDLIPLSSISRPLIPSTPTTNLPTSSCSWWCSQWRWHSHRPHDHLHDGPTTDAMTDPLTAKTEPMSDPISESLTDPMRDPRTSLKTDPKADAWLAPSTTPRSRPWLWSWPKVENCDFRAVLSYWSCIQLPYFFFLLQITLQPLWAQNGFSLSGLSNGKFPHNVSSQWIFLDTLDEIYPL